MLREHKPVVLEDFNGLWKRGDPEVCPPDHFIKATNIQYIHGGFKTRDPLDPYQTPSSAIKNILRVYTYTMQSGESLLILTTGGNIYHAVGPTTIYGPILTIPTMTDFSFVAIAGRAYITPFSSNVNSFGVNSEIGLQNEFTYVYKGDGTYARKAAGFPPSNNGAKPLVVYSIEDSGLVDAGTHIVAISYNDGSDGALGLFTAVHAPGSKQIQLDNIPIGPAGTVGRTIAMTKTVDLVIVTNSLTKTYDWAATIDGWTNVGGGSLAFSYDDTDHAVKITGSFTASSGEQAESFDAGISPLGVSWEDLGVPVGATVISAQITGWKRKVVANTNVALSILNATLFSGTSNICNGGNLATATIPVSTDAVYTAMTAGLVVAIDGNYGASSTEVQLKLELDTLSDIGAAATTDVRFDDVVLTITYTQLVTSLYGGDPSIYPFYDVYTIPDNVTTSYKINTADLSLTSTHSGTSPAAPTNTALKVEQVDQEGYCDAGLHLIGVVYETDTGYLTALGPEYFGVQTFVDTTKSIKVSNIPVSSDSFVVKRHLVATIAIPNFDGNETIHQLFFIPGGNIDDNTTTEWTGSFFDADLESDASHLVDNFSEIPAFVGLNTYHGRLVGYGEYNNISVARLSAPGEPEAISQVDGLIITPLDGYPVTNAQEYRDTLYVFKRSKTIAYSDNQDVPSSWQPNTIDQGVGASVHGIATVLDSGGVSIDFLIVVNFSGIMIFNGVFIRPELSWKIEDIWLALSENDFRYIQIVNNSITKKLWATLPPPYQNQLIHLDYGNGLDPKNVRFSIWEFSRPVASLTLIDTSKLILGMLDVTIGMFDPAIFDSAIFDTL